MAADCTDGDYLGAYSRFFAEFIARVNPHDQLPVAVSGYNVTEGEIVGEIIGVTLRYLNQTHCPPSLQAHVVHRVIQEIKTMCKKQPEDCGLRLHEKTYAPLELMKAVTSKVNEICTRYLDNSRLALLPPPPSTPLPEVIAGGSKNGRRKMEDRYVILHDLHTIFSIQDDSIANYYAVFDGHGGQDAAVYSATHLHQYLAESIHYPTDPERALRDAFLTTDAQFIEKSKRQKVYGGTTAICTLVLRKKLYVAWVGDSSGILVRRGQITHLVNPHRLTRPDEVQRVQGMGGLVIPNLGVMRVNGVLEISRAIGDVQYKPFVTGEPEIKCIPLDGTEDFIVIASDGLWDFVSPSDVAVTLYHEIRRRPNALKGAHQSLLQLAKRAGSTDNITVVVVLLTPACEIAERPQNAHPCLIYKSLPNDLMNNMDPKNPFLSNANGRHDAANGAFIKQVPQLLHHQHREEEHEQNGAEEQMDDNHIMYEASSNGKHENGDAEYDYSDLGPETDVDAIDDVPPPPVKNLSYELYAADDDDEDEEEDEDEDDSSCEEKETKAARVDVLEDNRMDAENDVPMEHGASLEDDERAVDVHASRVQEAALISVNVDSEEPKDDAPVDEEKVDVAGGDVVDDAAPLDYEDSPPSPQATKPLQHALIPEADNVADSEDSEDEWNFYRVDPNKEKDSAAAPVGEEQESKREQEAEGPEPDVEESTLKIQFPEVEGDIKCESPTEEVSPEHIDTKSNAEEEIEESKENETFVEQKEESEDMDFQLNPDAAEFVPVSPQILGQRLNLATDYPISGSPLKQVAPMDDDLQVPSQSEFEEEVCQRPSEIEAEAEKEECANGDHIQRADYTDFMMERQKGNGLPGNLDDSEISSTKAEFGDESASFLTASEFHRTGVSTVDESFSNSEREYDIAKDPMAMSFTPSDFEAAFDKGVDLNAVHDLSATDLEEKNGTLEDETAVQPSEQQEELVTFATSETDEVADKTPVHDEEQSDLLHTPATQQDEGEATFVEHASIEKSKVLEQEEVQPEHQPSEVEQFEQHDAFKSEPSPLTDNYSVDFESEKELISADNEQALSPSSVDIDETKPIDETSEDAILPATDSQKESYPRDEDTPSSLSPVPDVMECTTPQKEYELISSMENVQISSTPIVSSLRTDVAGFKPSQYSADYNPFPSEFTKPSSTETDTQEKPYQIDFSSCPFECSVPSSTNASTLQDHVDVEEDHVQVEESHAQVEESHAQVEEDHAQVEENKEPERMEIVTPEPVAQEQEAKQNLLDFAEEREVCTKSPIKHLEAELTPPFSPQESDNKLSQDINELMSAPESNTMPEDADIAKTEEDIVKTAVCELQIHEEVHYPEPSEPEVKEETPVMNLSESMQEFTGLEKQLLPEDSIPVESKPVELPKEEPQPAKEDETKVANEQEEPLLVTVQDTHDIKKEEAAPQIVPKDKEPEAEPEKEKAPETLEQEVKKEISTAVAAASAAVAAAAAVTAVAATTTAKPKTTKPSMKTTKSTSATKTTAKSTPISPSKTASATSRTSATTAAKKPATSTISRPKESDASKKPATSTSASRVTAAKPAAPVKSTTATTAAKTTTRTSLAAPKPKSATASPKPTLNAVEKKPTANGDVKPASKPAASKTISKTSTTTATAAKTSLVKTSTTSRTSTGTTTTKARPASATTNTKTTTTSRMTSATTTTSSGATRPKTAPITSTTTKSRITTAKSPMIDKQIKETANKQISLARTSSSTTSKTRTSTPATTTTTSTVKRTSTTKTLNATASPTKKLTTMTKITGRTSTGTKSSTVTSKTKVIQNGVSEKIEMTSTVITTNNKIEDDIPKKDLSPVVAPTDNQLIMSSD